MKYSRKWKQHSGFVLLWTATEAAHPPSSRRGITKLLPKLSVTAGTASVSSCALTSVCFVLPLAGCVWSLVCFISFWFTEMFHRNTYFQTVGENLPWNVTALWQIHTAGALKLYKQAITSQTTTTPQCEALLKTIRCMHSEVGLFAAPRTSLPGSTAHGIFQARILEWGAISYSKGSSRPRDQTGVSPVSRTGRQRLYH